MLKPSELPAPDTLIDYGNGQFGPLMLHYLPPDSEEAERVLDEQGYAVRFLPMQSDLGDDDDHPLMVEYFVTGMDDVCTRWTPTEQGEGWTLVGKHDTDDGPVAVFIKKSATLAAAERV